MLRSGIEVRSSMTHGRGLFATEAIPKGSVIWHPCPKCRVWSVEQLRELTAAEFCDLDEYGYWLEQGGIILPCTNAYLMNHSCTATVLDFGLDFGVAVRDLAPGDEVTCDYRTFVSDPEWKFSCRCGAENCSGEVATSQGLASRLQDHWRERLLPVLPLIPTVAQPLEESLMQCSPIYKRLRQKGPGTGPDISASIRSPAFLDGGFL